jgi:hypothetical protein
MGGRALELKEGIDNLVVNLSKEEAMENANVQIESPKIK